MAGLMHTEFDEAGKSISNPMKSSSKEQFILRIFSIKPASIDFQPDWTLIAFAMAFMSQDENLLSVLSDINSPCDQSPLLVAP